MSVHNNPLTRPGTHQQSTYYPPSQPSRVSEHRLSGELAAAVALVHAPEVLVLDEPTSAMDAEAEAKIFDHFRQITEDQMAILISHRFSTVRMADQIVVLEHGQIQERGTHEDLLDADGEYARLFKLQAAGYQ